MAPRNVATVSLNDLYDMSVIPHHQIIEDLLGVGTYILAGPPKIGKSYMVAQLSYHVATGKSLWGRPVTAGAVLYLALEDTYDRLHKRYYRMYGDAEVHNLYLGVKIDKDGVVAQLSRFCEAHPEIKLIIIDTLARIRNNAHAQSYQNDYEEIGKLKSFADKHSIALLLVHHTRKQPSDDSFAMISGTTGILGVVDGAYVLEKTDRTSNDARLKVTGRDYPDQLLQLRRTPSTLCWELVKEKRNLWIPDPDPILCAVAGLVSHEPYQWVGAPQELADALLLDMAPNRLTRHLNAATQRLLDEHQVLYTNRARHEGRRITLTLQPKNTHICNNCDDSNDSDDSDAAL